LRCPFLHTRPCWFSSSPTLPFRAPCVIHPKAKPSRYFKPLFGVVQGASNKVPAGKALESQIWVWNVYGTSYLKTFSSNQPNLPSGSPVPSFAVSAFMQESTGEHTPRRFHSGTPGIANPFRVLLPSGSTRALVCSPVPSAGPGTDSYAWQGSRLGWPLTLFPSGDTGKERSPARSRTRPGCGLLRPITKVDYSDAVSTPQELGRRA